MATTSTTETPADADVSQQIAALREQHLLSTHSKARGDGSVTHHAACSCAQIEYDWYRREDQHRDHVDLVIFNAGRDAATTPQGT